MFILPLSRGHTAWHTGTKFLNVLGYICINTKKLILVSNMIVINAGTVVFLLQQTAKMTKNNQTRHVILVRTMRRDTGEGRRQVPTSLLLAIKQEGTYIRGESLQKYQTLPKIKIKIKCTCLIPTLDKDFVYNLKKFKLMPYTYSI